MKTKTPTPHLRRLESAIDAQIREHARCRRLLSYVDAELFTVGIAMAGSPAGLVSWLCAPARALGYKVPLRVMRTRKGREAVLNLIRAITHGVYQ